jgi:hypothetical protein
MIPPPSRFGNDVFQWYQRFMKHLSQWSRAERSDRSPSLARRRLLSKLSLHLHQCRGTWSAQLGTAGASTLGHFFSASSITIYVLR